MVFLSDFIIKSKGSFSITGQANCFIVFDQSGGEWEQICLCLIVLLYISMRGLPAK